MWCDFCKLVFMKILLYIIILISVINLSVSQNFNLDSIDNLNSEDKYSAYQTIYKSVLNSDSIDAVPNGKMIAVSITDNGVGMDNEKINKLFKIDKDISTEGTNN